MLVEKNGSSSSQGIWRQKLRKLDEEQEEENIKPERKRRDRLESVA